MGEYYTPVLVDENDNVEGYFLSHHFGSWFERTDGTSVLIGVGLKFMEHCYVGNLMVDAVCACLKRGRHKVGWLGDYTPRNMLPGFIPETTIDALWGDGPGYIRELPVPEHELCEDTWLLNHTRKMAVRIPAGGDHVIHPLPVLTCTDQAPGYNSYEGEDFVGDWAWDLLSIDDTIPENYDILDIDFSDYE